MFKNITFVYGATSATINVNSTNVGSFLDAYGPTYGVPDDGISIRVNGNNATRATELQTGDRLEVIKASGTKG